MASARAPLSRHLHRDGSAAQTPLQGSHNVKPSDGVGSLRSSEACQGAGKQKSKTNLSSEKSAPTPVTARRLTSLGSTPANGIVKTKKDLMLMKEKKKQKALEKEIRALARERGEQDKKLKALEEDLVKIEAKLSAAVQEKTSLSANLACLKKQLLEITRSNELLKSKLSEDGLQKKMSSLCMELMKLRNMRDAKEKTALAKQEDMEMKLQEVQRNLEHSKGEVAQLQEKLSATEREKVEEKSDTEKLLEYVRELSTVAETAEKYKLKIIQVEETLSKKDQDIEILRNTLKAKEEESCKLLKELNERCQLLQQEKEKELSEAKGQFLSMNAEIEDLKKKIYLVEQEHQKLLQKHQEVISQLQQEKESSASMQQKLLEFEDEVTSERHLLKEELNDAMKELNKLHVKEKKAENLVKRLEQEIKSQDLELAQMKEELKGKNLELEQIKAMHSSAVLKIQEEHSNTLQKLGKTVADFESYKKTSSEEISSFKLENTSLQEEVASLKKIGQENLQLIQEAEYNKNKTNEECARMLLEIQTKLALKEAETERTKESCLAEITKLQEKFEEQTEVLKSELEAERSRKTISEDVTSNLKKEIETWRKLYEDLHNKVKPFQQQLDAFEAEKNALLEEHGAAQEELNKLSDAYAKLLGHQNMKQKIKHVMKLKEDNAHLKQDVSKLRSLLAKEKQTNRHLQEQLCAVQGIKRFDPSKAFQHDSKENIPPKTPLKEGNKNKI
ncbi:hyaluronan mediated motility receptor isoform X1 [Catharus ustulatus]|uniref:Hyaluronan-mediated motility receptor C-terminal domain-containing protein n=1 Tax=Catharus ustulatus TaxID=91951 RepID=A0A8C3V3V5_CATUS|nr:hyaluronan mediated motility receptor isoform X1 [Catharus ustulatus]